MIPQILQQILQQILHWLTSSEGAGYIVLVVAVCLVFGLGRVLNPFAKTLGWQPHITKIGLYRVKRFIDEDGYTIKQAWICSMWQFWYPQIVLKRTSDGEIKLQFHPGLISQRKAVELLDEFSEDASWYVDAINMKNAANIAKHWRRWWNYLIP